MNGAEVERAVAAVDRAAELLEDALDELADAIRACGDSAGDALHGAGFFLPPEDVARVLTGSGLVIRWEVAR